MRWLITVIGLAALCNGIVFWLRRVGLLQREEYWLAYQRLVELSRLEGPSWERYIEILQFGASVHTLQGAWWLTKIPKELVWGAVLLVALLRARHALSQPLVLKLTYGALFTLIAISAADALLHGRWLETMAGARSFFCWVLAALGVALSSSGVRRSLTHVLIWVLVVQGLIAPVELTLGLKTYSMNLLGTDYPRIVGTFALPVSLGTFTVVVWAMALCWSALPGRTLRLLTLLVVALLICNASATAWAAFATSAGIHQLNQRTAGQRLAILVVALPVVLIGWQGLPQLTGRSDIHDSLFGRALAVQLHAGATLSPTELLLGHGFGLGTNAYSQLSPRPTAPVTPVDWTATHAVGDSMPASLLWQIGIAGIVLTYGLLLAGIVQNRRDQPIGVALLLASLTLNITELFPINLILGLWLATAWPSPPITPAPDARA